MPRDGKEKNEMGLTEAKNCFSKYKDFPFREHQEEAIKFILESEKKIAVVEAATGSGKSLLGMVAGAAMGGIVYLVHSKVLQNQITTDFPEAESLFGRSNYPCLIDPANMTCDECLHTKWSPCPFKKECAYEVRKKKVLEATFKVLNYDYFLSEANYIGKFSRQKCVVIDEADNLENTLINFAALTFTQRNLWRLGLKDLAVSLKMTSKFKEQLLYSWLEFGNLALAKTKEIIQRLNGHIACFGQQLTEEQVITLKERNQMVRLQERVQLFVNNVDDTWQLDNQGGTLIFRPLWMTTQLADEFLWKHAYRFVLMSASFYPKQILAKCLGLDTLDIDWHVVPSQFPIRNRPIYVIPSANLTAKTAEIEIPKLFPVVKQIADKYPAQKGIVHAVSYKLAKSIVEGVGNERFITHSAANRQETLNKFLKSSQPYILVSPSMERGVSMEDEKCRFIIIVKAPFLSLGDKITSNRLYSSRIGQEWYTATMLLTMLQMAGRGVRSKDDYADTYILDLQAKNAIMRNPGYLPMWWRDALEFELPESVLGGRLINGQEGEVGNGRL